MRPKKAIAVVGLTLAALAAYLPLTMGSERTAVGISREASKAPLRADAIPLAVIGDSNSQSYQDPRWFPASSPERGGPNRTRTFQWTEVLARLRGDEVDLGPWVRWGRPGVIARARELIGLRGGRAPEKDDYLYNFANSGASCKNIMDGRFRQAPRLVQLMDEEPERWKRGVVLIRIGLNDWGGLLDLQVNDPAGPESRAATAFCVNKIGAAIALIHASHPSTRILVSGIGNEADDPANFDRWRTAKATANIRAALDGFNGALLRLTTGDPRLAFFDELPGFEAKWGSRDPDGVPAYKTVSIGEKLRVTNTAGDGPQNVLLADHHAGLVVNTIVAQALLLRMREAFDLPLTPISDDEVRRFIEPLASASIAPGS